MDARRVCAAVFVLALGALGLTRAAAAPQVPSQLIERAAIAPYRAVLLREPAALCASFTPAVAARLVAGSSPAGGCEQGAAEVFARALPSPLTRQTIESLQAKTDDLELAADHAVGDFELVAVTGAVIRGVSTTKATYYGTLRLALEQVGGRWLVASAARLAAVPGCSSGSQGPCPAGSKSVFFVLGIPVVEPLGAGIPVPTAVQRGGGRLKAEYAGGRSVYLGSGCGACHRIGAVGNRGPGANLTHIGSHLSPGRLERAIVDAKAPMPSFSRLPKLELHQLVRFLSLLR
jgi:hypothetical protein